MSAEDFSSGASGSGVKRAKRDKRDGQNGHTRKRLKKGNPLGRRRIRVLPQDRLAADLSGAECNALDAAAFLAQVPRPMSWLKLQDLLYFAQAWHLVWDNTVLFPEPILAADHGVRISVLDDLLSGSFEVSPGQLRRGLPARLGESRQRTLSGIVKFYGKRSHFRLSQAIISEEPWTRARSLGPEQPIDLACLHRHYRKQL